MKGSPRSSLVFLIVLVSLLGSLPRGQSFGVVPLHVYRNYSPRKAFQSSSSSQFLRIMMMGPLETFDYCLAHHQLPTESTLSACLAVLGDTAAQLRAANNVSSLDWRRTNAFFIKGAVAGVLWSRWYAFVDPIGRAWASCLSPADNWTESVRIVLSVCMDLFVFCPLLFCTWDLPFPMLARGDPLESIPSKVQAKIGAILQDNTRVWMVPNLIIYSLPMHYRVVVTSCIDAVWQMMLSDALAKPLPPPSMLPPPKLEEDVLRGEPVFTETLAEQTQ